MTLRGAGLILLILVTYLAVVARTGRVRGRFEDAHRNYIEFRLTGNAFTNFGTGAGEDQITYDREGDRVTLHELDGNPTMRFQQDGSLCCGPGGPLRRVN